MEILHHIMTFSIPHVSVHLYFGQFVTLKLHLKSLLASRKTFTVHKYPHRTLCMYVKPTFQLLVKVTVVPWRPSTMSCGFAPIVTTLSPHGRISPTGNQRKPLLQLFQRKPPVHLLLFIVMRTAPRFTNL